MGKGTKLLKEQFLSMNNFSWGANSQMFDKKILGETLFKSNILYISEKLLKHK